MGKVLECFYIFCCIKDVDESGNARMLPFKKHNQDKINKLISTPFLVYIDYQHQIALHWCDHIL